MVALSRRKLLQLAAFGVAAQMLPFRSFNALAQSAGDEYRALICIFLFGGNDGDNMVVPMDGQAYQDYATVRGALAHPVSNLLQIGVIDPSQSPYGLTMYGLHPSMTHLSALASHLAVVANVGTLVEPMTKDEYLNRLKPRPQALFSHSDQQAQMQNASPLQSSFSGWGGRIIDRLQSLNPVASFPAGISMSGNNVLLVGEQSRPVSLSGGDSILLSGASGTAGEARTVAMQQTLGLDSGFGLMQAANATLSQGILVGQAISDALGASTLTTPFPNSSLGRQLQQVAQLIQAREALGMQRQVFFCSTGGFDTHSDQLPQHANILGGLSQAMAAFYEATVEMNIADKVTTFTESDFGRTFQPNPTLGTDHAWGSYQLVLGGAVSPGFYGTLPTLQLNGPDSTDGRGRWIPTTGLDQYGATLASWFGIGDGDMSTVFSNINNFPVSNLGFLNGPVLL